jgi:hypothetical protein
VVLSISSRIFVPIRAKNSETWNMVYRTLGHRDRGLVIYNPNTP